MRVTLLLVIVASMASIAAVCGDQAAPPTARPAITACPAETPACATAQRTPRPTPAPADPEALAIFRSDPAVTLLLRGMSAGRDYWLGFDGPTPKNERGERLATITIVFREEFHFSGSVPLFSEPCSPIGVDEGPAAADPCRKAPRTYRTEAVNWTGGSRLLRAIIDLDRRAIVGLFNLGSLGSADVEYYRELYDGSY